MVGKTKNVIIQRYLDSSYENTQEMGVSNMACQDEINEPINMAMGTETLEDVEKIENIQASIQDKSLSWDEEALYIINQLTKSPSLQEGIQDSFIDIQTAAPPVIK